jgi:hypothetical protein
MKQFKGWCRSSVGSIDLPEKRPDSILMLHDLLLIVSILSHAISSGRQSSEVICWHSQTLAEFHYQSITAVRLPSRRAMRRDNPFYGDANCSGGSFATGRTW